MKDEAGRGEPLGSLLSSGIFGSSSNSDDSIKDTAAVEDENEDQSEPRSSGWNFGGFIRTLASKSGGVLQAYQQDLEEFRIGLKKETEAVAEVTAHAVKDLPLSLETGATVAQVSLETVGQTIEDFGSSVWRGTTEIFAQVKEAVLNVDEEAPAAISLASPRTLASSASSGKYSRYEAQVSAMQRDSSTYCDEPEDEEEYAAWLSTFNLDKWKGEIDEILAGNPFMLELQSRMVPIVVEHDVFWTRYFFRIHKLQQIENARANLVKRATAEEEEDLSWDVEEEKEAEEVQEPKVDVVDNAEAATSVDVLDVTPTAMAVEETHDEEEAKSEGSAGSEWLVVPEEKTPGSSEPTKSTPSSPRVETSREEMAAAALKRRMDDGAEGDEPELEDIAELTIEDAPLKPGAEKVSSVKVASALQSDETEEDWGEWE